ncbi:Trafficking protein particle complex subunit 10, partial [Exaiptasia diaphana]
IGRSRAAKSLGMELALFFMSRKEYERAEPLLASIYQVYRHERWTPLATQVLMKLALCQKELKNLNKYPFCMLEVKLHCIGELRKPIIQLDKL